MNILDIFLNSWFKNNLRKKKKDLFEFLTKMLGKICCHGNHDMCKTFYEHSGYFS
jgi:hypothetical protein